jgi:hypothetical protein
MRACCKQSVCGVVVILRWLSSGLLHHVVWEKFSDVAVVFGASIIRTLIALMMEAASTPETSVNFYQTTQCNNPEDSHLHTRSRENFSCLFV